MNSFERISRTISGGKLDRRAISPILPLYGARLTGCDLKSYYTESKKYMEGQDAILETFKPDVLFGPFALAIEGAAFGSKIRYFENQAPNLEVPVISSMDEIDKVAVPDKNLDKNLLYFRESIRGMASLYGSEVPVAAIISGPVDLPAMLLGIEGWIETLLFDADGTKKMLELSIRHSVDFMNALFSDGASFIALPVNFANPSMVTREIAEKITVPALLEAFSQIDGPVFIHSGGSVLSPFIELFADLSNVAGYVLNGGDDFGQAREKIGPEPVLAGNIEGPGLIFLDEVEIMNCLHGGFA